MRSRVDHDPGIRGLRPYPELRALRAYGRRPGEAAPAAPADGTQVGSRVMVQFRPVLRRQPVERAHLPTYVLPVIGPPTCASCCGSAAPSASPQPPPPPAPRPRPPPGP